MSDVLDNIYLPNFEKRKIRESEPYQLLKENNIDPSSLEGYYDTEAKKHATPIEFTELNSINDKEEWLSKHVNKEVYKEYFSNIGDFFVETGKDTALSLATAVVNGADVAVNMMPLMVKALDKFPLPGSAPGTLSTETEDKLMQTATTISNNLDGVRNYLNDFKKDDNFVSQLIGIASQDMLYSIPIYNKLKAIGMPKYPAFFLSGGIGGAIGIEKKVLGGESTFVHHFFEKDLVELKNLVGILPNTPYDKIADEAIQALEYGVFSAALPGVIDALKFMKKNIPAFASTAVGTTALTVGNEVEANPLKAIANAVTKVPVFKSAVVDAATKLPKGSGEQIFNTIKNTPGVKESELKWIGLEDFLKDKKQVTQQEVLDFIEQNKIDVTEVMFPKKGTSFGLYDNILQTLEQNKIKFINSRKDLKGGDQRIDFDNIFVSTKTLDNNPIQNERITFNSFSNSPNGRIIRSFEDPNTFEIDVDAIKKNYQSDEKGYVDFYIVDDISTRSKKAISKSDFENPEINTIVKTAIKQEPVGPKYELDYINQISFDELEKYSLESQLRTINELRSTQLGTTKYDRYTEYGGTDYKELILKMRQIAKDVGRKDIPVETKITKSANLDEYGIDESPHFNEPNEIAHVRFKTRYGEGLDDGKKILSIEEMQSDLVQNVKKFNKASIQYKRQELIQAEGTRQVERNRFENMSEEDIQKQLSLNPPDDLIKDFPFKNNWYELVIKRLVRYAADNGFDAISFPQASIIQDRYALTKRVNELNVTAYFPERQEIGIMGRDQNGVSQIDELFSYEKLKKSFGEDTQKKLIDLASKYYKGDDLKTAELNYKAIINNEDYPKLTLNKEIEFGGEGKANLYDKTIPSYLKKYAKKWNADVYKENFRVDDLNIDSEFAPDRIIDIPVTVMEITPEMKQGVQSNSQPLFELFGTVGLSTWGAKTVSDNIENNIISEKTF
jgi:hypothetical protein